LILIVRKAVRFLELQGCGKARLTWSVSSLLASLLVAFSFLVFLCGGSPKGEGKSNVLGIPLFLLLFLVFLLLLKVPKGTPNLRKIERKGKAS